MTQRGIDFDFRRMKLCKPKIIFWGIQSDNRYQVIFMIIVVIVSRKAVLIYFLF